jgi:hypothetical protein
LFACGGDGVHFFGQEEQICGRYSGEEGLEPVLVFSPYHCRHGSGIDLLLFFFFSSSSFCFFFFFFFFSSNSFVFFFLLLFPSQLFQVYVLFLFYLEKETTLFLSLLFFLMWKIEHRSIHNRFPFVFLRPEISLLFFSRSEFVVVGISQFQIQLFSCCFSSTLQFSCCTGALGSLFSFCRFFF